MTVDEAKDRIRMLLDAYTEAGAALTDPDLEKRIPGALDGAQKYVAGIKPIRRSCRLSAQFYPPGPAAVELPTDFSAPLRLLADWKPVPGRFYDHRILLPGGDSREFRLEYEAKPETVDLRTPGSRRLELDEDACVCAAIYAAATLAVGDPSCDSAGLMALFQRQAAGLRSVGNAEMQAVRLI